MLLRRINEILDIAKSEAKKTTITVCQYDVVKILEEVIAAEHLGIAITLSAIDPHAVYFDPDKIERVITNIINNALKFTPPGDEINVQVNDFDEDHRIKITDSGISMTAEQIIQRIRSLLKGVNPNIEYLSIVKQSLNKHRLRVCRYKRTHLPKLRDSTKKGA